MHQNCYQSFCLHWYLFFSSSSLILPHLLSMLLAAIHSRISCLPPSQLSPLFIPILKIFVFALPTTLATLLIVDCCLILSYSHCRCCDQYCHCHCNLNFLWLFVPIIPHFCYFSCCWLLLATTATPIAIVFSTAGDCCSDLEPSQAEKSRSKPIANPMTAMPREIEYGRTSEPRKDVPRWTKPRTAMLCRAKPRTAKPSWGQPHQAKLRAAELSKVKPSQTKPRTAKREATTLSIFLLYKGVIRNKLVWPLSANHLNEIFSVVLVVQVVMLFKCSDHWHLAERLGKTTLGSSAMVIMLAVWVEFSCFWLSRYWMWLRCFAWGRRQQAW